VALLLAVTAGSTVSTGRYETVVAALVGLAVAWSVTSRRNHSESGRPGRRARAALYCVALGAGLVAIPERLDGSLLPAAGSVPADYVATGQLDGSVVALREAIVLPDPASPAPAGWTAAGPNSFVRTRTVTPTSGTPMKRELTIPLDLGSVTIAGRSLPLVVGEGSRVALVLREGALGATVPAPTTTERDADGNQVTTVPVGPGDAAISVTVLSEMMRSRPGLYHALAWPGMPWVLGILYWLVSSRFWDRLLRFGFSPMEPSSRRKSLVHDVQPDEPPLTVVERLRDGRHDLESERLPQAYRGDVCLDHRVELHAVVPRGPRPPERVSAQRPARAPAVLRRVDHEAGGGDVRTPPQPVRPHLR
jgi:hypothetical protein